MFHDPALALALPHASRCRCPRCMVDHRRHIAETKRDILLGLVLGAIAAAALVAIRFWPAIAAALAVRP